MTGTNRPVTRRTQATVFDRGNRRVIVTIGPGDIQSFRLERQKQVYRANLTDLFHVVARWHVDGERRKFDKRVKELLRQGLTKRAAKAQARREIQ